MARCGAVATLRERGRETHHRKSPQGPVAAAAAATLDARGDPDNTPQPVALLDPRPDAAFRSVPREKKWLLLGSGNPASIETESDQDYLLSYISCYFLKEILFNFKVYVRVNKIIW